MEVDTRPAVSVATQEKLFLGALLKSPSEKLHTY